MLDFHYAVAFSDLHAGKARSLVMAELTTNIMFPKLVGNDIGCGNYFTELLSKSLSFFISATLFLQESLV